MGEQEQRELFAKILEQLDFGTLSTDLVVKLFPERFFTEFGDVLNNGFKIPVSNAFKNFYTKLDAKLQEFSGKKIDELVDPFGFGEATQEIKNKRDSYIQQLDAKYKKILNEESNNIPNIANTPDRQQPEPQQKSGLALEQAEFDNPKFDINFTVETKRFLENLLDGSLKKFILGQNNALKQFTGKNFSGGSASGGIFDSLLSGAEMGVGQGLVSRLFAKKAAGAAVGEGIAATEGAAAELTGAEIAAVLGGGAGLALVAAVGGLILTPIFAEKMKPFVEKTLGVKLDDRYERGANVAQDIGKIAGTSYLFHTAGKAREKDAAMKANKEAQELAEAQKAERQLKAGESLIEKEHDLQSIKTSLKSRNLSQGEILLHAKEMENLEKEIEKLRSIAYPIVESGTVVVKETTSITKSLYTVVKSMFNGKLVQKLLGPTVAKIAPRLLGGSLKALKVIPGIGAIISGYFAWDRYQKGDYLGSLLEGFTAIMDILSLVSAPTGVGLVLFEALAIAPMVIEGITDWMGVTGGDYRKTEDQKTRTVAMDKNKILGGFTKFINESKLLKGIAGVFSLLGSLVSGLVHWDFGIIANAWESLFGKGSADNFKSWNDIKDTEFSKDGLSEIMGNEFSGKTINLPVVSASKKQKTDQQSSSNEDQTQSTEYDNDVFSENIRGFFDNKGVKHVLDNKDQSNIVSAKEGGVMLKALNDIKNVMIRMNNNISSLSNMQPATISAPSVSISGGGGGGQGSMYADGSILRERKSYYAFRGKNH